MTQADQDQMCSFKKKKNKEKTERRIKGLKDMKHLKQDMNGFLENQETERDMDFLYWENISQGLQKSTGIA